VTVTQAFDCQPLGKPLAEKTIIRGNEAPELRWAGGAMRAHLDVGTKVSPELYLGRLEGTAPVPEHDHPASTETLVAVEAAGTYTVDGKEHRLGPKQIVTLPKGTKHSWRPDPGSRLVAIQIYDPPGPEQRFVTLAAAEKDAGAIVADGGRR
jgi:quercetin dioxygenase-like cupin family protein